ncbi:serine/threonine protein kinase [Bacillus sp. M6-12]|uniref:protein kinase domain-containing protein n=1 Tax=Bacillus sp. M6-12 TaxID=2054166 RepID=UPI000C7709B0|nr:serine/threonine protein kinase [Bacillus sp. M6-12]PLS15135.1 serine/threonine protein kinase [Bacillus sp. M6-12]
MMNNTLRNQCNVPPGSVITGKWNGNRYRIIKELGFGATGIVYLAELNGQYAALKLSNNGLSITSEMNILKAFSKVQGSALGPSLLEADDWEKPGIILPFYVMEYIQGDSFLDFIKVKGPAWTGVLMLQLLTSLADLHEQGWVFGDLKPENLIVTTPSYKVRCIDVGGTTKQGRSIKEFTEFFDRGYWGLGSRKADPKYDLFAAAMVMVNASYPKRFQKKGDEQKQILEAVNAKKELRPFKMVIEKAITGRYESANNMRQDIMGVLSLRSDRAVSSTRQSAKGYTRQNRQTIKNSQPPTRSHAKKKRSGFAETFLLVMIVSLLYALYLYRQVM